MKKLILVVSVSAALAACSATEPENAMNKRLAELERQQIEMTERQEAREQAQREQELESVPDWVMDPPDSDATGFYGVGVAQSKSLNHARKSARLQAEFELAKMSRQELSGSERAYEQGNSDGDVESQTTFLIDKVVDAVPVVGYDVVDQELTPVDGVYHAYVLLKLPYNQFNTVLQQQRASEKDDKVQAAFDDLERRLDKRRQEKAQQEQLEHERELEKMKARSEMLNDAAADNAEVEAQQSVESAQEK